MAEQIKITLPDGSVHQHPSGVTAMDIAKSISSGLARRMVAARSKGQVISLLQPLTTDTDLELLDFNTPEGRDVYWHSSAHILAQAVKELYPGARLGVGPPVEAGFYYDIEFPEPFSAEDLEKVEAKMQEIVRKNIPFIREEISRDAAVERFREMDEPYKVELIEKFPDDEVISMYHQEEFTDLCRGPHLPGTGSVKAFKLLRVAGAYWLGDENNAQLQRVYGISFPDKKLLKDHLKMLEEAKKRDHRRLGRELDLFSFHEEGPGFPFWHPRGMVLYNALLDFWKHHHQRENYEEIKTPIILNEELWHRSGHWDNYQENMYFTRIDEQDYAVKPMNCPGHCLVYKSNAHSYRDLPLKLAELGLVHRHEKSGVMHGLMRVRMFTQDDAHVFCTPDQIEAEVVKVINLVFEIYRTFGFEDVHVELSTRPEEKYIGSLEVWDKAESALAAALQDLNIDYQINPGDGAFYGPKIDFHVRDSLRRSWQLGTIQLDFSMPERFELEYIGQDGEKHRPVMIHRAILGSLERFIGILIEHYAGNFPLWLAPDQIALLPITDDQNPWAEEVAAQLREQGFRVTVDIRNEKIGYKIRQAELLKIPFMGIVGGREAEDNTVSLRIHGSGDQGVISVDELLNRLREEQSQRGY